MKDEIASLLIGEADASQVDPQGRGSYDTDPGAWRSREACYSCGRRGHTHFTCPGAVVEEPVIRRLIPVDAPDLGRED